MLDTLVYGGAGMDKSRTGYSNLFYTDMTSKLNELYGINETEVDILTGNCPLDVFLGEIPVPMTRETAEKLRGAEIMYALSHETDKVIRHFLDMVKRGGQFVALPYDEIANAAGIPRSYVDKAASEHYFRVSETTIIKGQPLRIMELTDKLLPVN